MAKRYFVIVKKIILFPTLTIMLAGLETSTDFPRKPLTMTNVGTNNHSQVLKFKF